MSHLGEDEIPRKKAWRRPSLRDVLKILLGISLLAWLILKIDPRHLREGFARQNGEFLVYAVLAFVLLILLQAWRLHLLGGALTGSYGRTLRLVLAGFFFNNFLPSNLGGDVYKVVYMAGGEGRWSGATVLVLLDRALGLGVVLLAGLASLPFVAPQLREAVSIDPPNVLMGSGPLSAVVAVAVFGVAYMLWRARRTRTLGRARATVRAGLSILSRIRFRTYVFAFVLAVAAFMARVLRFILFSLFFGLDLGVWELVLVVMFLNLVGTLPLSVGGLGVQEGAIAAGLALFGVSVSVGGAMAVLNRAATWLIALAGGVAWLTMKRAGT